jgi:shikimate kinase
MDKTLFFLIGLKGSGKTAIGNLIGRSTEIRFLQVEPIRVQLQPGENGWQKVEEAIDSAFQSSDRVMVESLGAGDGFQKMKSSLSKKYNIKWIHIVADPAKCLLRVQNRENTNHIPVSDTQVVEYNKFAATIRYDWDMVIDNNLPMNEKALVEAIQKI